MFALKAIRGTVRSLPDFFRLVFGKRAQVVISYPQHFNRGSGGENPFIVKLVAALKREGIRYLLLESPEYGMKIPHNKEALRIDGLFWIMTVVHKFLDRRNKGFTRRDEKRLAGIINLLTFGKLKVGCHITMAGLLMEAYQEMNPEGVVYDLQHGVIYEGHPGYFSGHESLSYSFAKQNSRILVWGERFCKIFDSVLPVDERERRVINIGYPIERDVKGVAKDKSKKVVLFSAQLTDDLDVKFIEKQIEMLDAALTELDALGCEVLIKHHPRYNNVIDISEIFAKHPTAKLTDLPFDRLVPSVKLQVTLGSTTTFEYAQMSIPTFFLRDEEFDWASEIFYKQYGYPLYDGMTIGEAVGRIGSAGFEEDCAKVRDWYLSIYSPFDGRKFLDEIKNVIKK